MVCSNRYIGWTRYSGGVVIPAFCFTIVECDVSGGPEWRDCVDYDDAESYATRMARDIITADLAAGCHDLSCHIDIADGDGRTVGKVELSFSIARASDRPGWYNPG